MPEPSLASQIESVMVFLHGAEVTRVAPLDGVAGTPAHVRVDGLPPSLDDASLRVRVRGAGPAPRATDVRVALGIAPADPALPPPDDEALRAARREVDALRDQLAQLEQQIARIEPIRDVERPEGAEGQPPPPSPRAARRALVALRHEELDALAGRLEEQRAALRDAEERRDDLEARVRSSARQARPHELRKGARVALQWPDGAAGEGHALALTYRVPGACWAPAYTVALDRALTRVELAVRAVVAQRSGEDWAGVPLTVSTAAIQRWFDLPELQAVRIGRRQPAPPRTGWRPPPTGAGALYEDFDRAAARAVLTRSELAAAGEPIDEQPEEDWDLDDELAAEEFAVSEAAMALEEPAWDRAEEKAEERDVPLPSAPPPPQAAPAPEAAMAPPAPMRAKRAAMPLASQAAHVFGGLADALSPGEAPPRAGGGGAPPPPEVPIDAAAEQLAYGSLRMPGPRDGRRGRLVRVRRREWARELLREVEVEVEFDVVDALARAADEAGSAGEAGLPAGHHAPRPWDGFDAVYPAEGTVDVPSDGEYHAVPLLAREGEVAVHHVVVPRESTDVFRLAAFHNPLSWPLLRGPAEVTVGGDYLLTAELPASPPRGEVELGLGVDQAVKVARNTTYEEESAGLIKGSLRLHHGIRVEVANRRERALEIEVRERIPSVRDKEEDIEVEIGTVEPPWEAWEPEDHELRGGHRWRLSLDAGAEQTLRADYTVTIAAKHELVGGNRREA